MSAIVVAVGNQKGGVGKTTTTVNLGHAFAASGIPTLIVDLDPQANATSALGFEKKPGAGIYGPITGNGSTIDQVQATRSENLWILPSELDLAAAELELGGQPDYLLKLRECLATLKEGYGLSVILVDCPPTLGLLSMNALCAADYLLVTLQCEYLALEGLGQILGVVDQLRDSGANYDLKVGGIAMTMFDNRTRLSYDVWEEVGTHYPQLMFRTAIPRSVRLSEAPSHGQSIFEYDPAGPGAQAYRNLADEVLARFFPQSPESS